MFLAAGLTAKAQEVPSPKSHFGFAIGDNYHLTNYTQTEAYFKKLAASSKRVKLVDIGKTEEGRSQYMLIVTSPENHKNLEKYKAISQKLARVDNLSDAEAKELAAQGKAVVWIDGGLHATENVGANQLIETAYQLISRTDAETTRILDDVIILMTHANPDGHELQGNWYMRNPEPSKRRTSPLPRLYQKYAGHDNNRDFFMLNLKETQNIAKQLFVEWHPQIMYNHHQSGPAGTIVAGPPFRDPHNYAIDPIILTSLDAVGAAMHNRLNVEGKPGYTQRNGSVFSTWYNGGLRTTTYFHNMVGLLTEIVGNPTPMDIPLVPNRLLPNSDSANPVTPKKWYFRNAIDYSVTLNYAVLNYANRYRDELLFSIFKMGQNAIERGNTDTWSLAPKKIEAIKASAAAGGEDLSKRSIDTKYFNKVMKDPNLRDARGYILPANQADLSTAVKFLNALIKTGITVQQASAAFTVEGKEYPAGSYVVKTDQPFRAHVLDMFEPQDHPNDFKYPGGPPVAPYDAAGWTLAYIMNIKFDRVLNGFDGPFKKLPYGTPIQLPKPDIAKGGFVLSAQSNESFIAVNDLMKAGVGVVRNAANGDFYIADGAKAKTILDKSKFDFGLNLKPAPKPTKTTKVAPLRIALLDTYGGTMTSGWARLIFENFRYPFTVVYPPDVDAGKLKNYDVLVVLSGVLNVVNSKETAINQSIPEEYKAIYGDITKDKSIPQLKDFLNRGGKIVAIGSGARLANHFNLPISDALVVNEGGTESKLSNDKFYVPGSVLQVKVDRALSSNWGLDENTDIYFDANAVYKINDVERVKPLAWFDTDKPLRSGWAWGQEYLKGGVAAFEAQVGKGKVVVFSPNITFRSQTHGTFKWLFNQLYQ
jgi:hypothetical protein